MRKQIKYILPVCLLSLGIFLQVLYQKGFFLPGWVIWQNKTVSFTAEEEMTLSLRDKQLFLTAKDGKKERLLAKDWLIADILVCDLDHDEELDILLLVFNRRNYGSYRPIWEDTEEHGFHEHLYIYNFRNNTLLPKWMSSELKPMIAEISADEKGILHVEDPLHNPSQWAWRSWGLERIDAE